MEFSLYSLLFDLEHAGPDDLREEGPDLALNRKTKTTSRNWHHLGPRPVGRCSMGLLSGVTRSSGRPRLGARGGAGTSSADVISGGSTGLPALTSASST